MTHNCSCVLFYLPALPSAMVLWDSEIWYRRSSPDCSWKRLLSNLHMRAATCCTLSQPHALPPLVVRPTNPSSWVLSQMRSGHRVLSSVGYSGRWIGVPLPTSRLAQCSNLVHSAVQRESLNVSSTLRAGRRQTHAAPGGPGSSNHIGHITTRWDFLPIQWAMSRQTAGELSGHMDRRLLQDALIFVLLMRM